MTVVAVVNVLLLLTLVVPVTMVTMVTVVTVVTVLLLEVTVEVTEVTGVTGVNSLEVDVRLELRMVLTVKLLVLDDVGTVLVDPVLVMLREVEVVRLVAEALAMPSKIGYSKL